MMNKYKKLEFLDISRSKESWQTWLDITFFVRAAAMHDLIMSCSYQNVSGTVVFFKMVPVLAKPVATHRSSPCSGEFLPYLIILPF